MNKLDNIDTQFRFFKMEVLAGEEDFIVQAVFMFLIVVIVIEVPYRTSQTANLNSTFPKSIGILDYIPNINVLSLYSNQERLSQMFLLVLAHLLFQPLVKGAWCLPMT